jgi:hypothetical protein
MAEQCPGRAGGDRQPGASDWEVPAATPMAVSPMGGPEGLWSGNQPQLPDIGGWGNHEYGNRVGIFLILAVLDKYGITLTLALDKPAPGREQGVVADHYPTLVKEGQRRGAEFIAHGLSRRRIMRIGMSEGHRRRHRRILPRQLLRPGEVLDR